MASPSATLMDTRKLTRPYTIRNEQAEIELRYRHTCRRPNCKQISGNSFPNARAAVVLKPPWNLQVSRDRSLLSQSRIGHAAGCLAAISLGGSALAAALAHTVWLDVS